MAVTGWRTLSRFVLILLSAAVLLTSAALAQAIGLGCSARCGDSVELSAPDASVYE